MTYSIDEVLSNIHNSTGSVLLGGGVIFIGYYFYCSEAIRLGFRDKTHAIPVFANMYYFAHDLIFISLYKRWFFEIDHWLYKAFWFGMVVFTMLECVIHYQTLRYSREELFPKLTQAQYTFVYVCMQLAVSIVFWFMYSQIDDYFYLFSIASSIVVSVAVMLPLLHARDSQKGQSRILAASLIISPIGFFFLFLPAMSDYFLGFPYIAMGVTTVITASVYFWSLPSFSEYLQQDSAAKPGPIRSFFPSFIYRHRPNTEKKNHPQGSRAV